LELLHTGHAMPDLTALCGAGSAWVLLGIATALFTTGLLGGFAHCAPMCGPFVLLQLPGEAAPTMLRRLGGGLMPGYHLGRLTTYVALGATLGAAGGAVATLGPFRWLIAALLATASLAFLLQALKRILPVPAGSLGTGVGLLLARWAAPLFGRGAFRGYALGVVLGFLPCGFLYAALIAASATGSAFGGAAAMTGFALGTAPALAVLGICGAGALQRFRRLGAVALTPVLLLNAATLAAFAFYALG